MPEGKLVRAGIEGNHYIVNGVDNQGATYKITLTSFIGEAYINGIWYPIAGFLYFCYSSTTDKRTYHLDYPPCACPNKIKFYSVIYNA